MQTFLFTFTMGGSAGLYLVSDNQSYVVGGHTYAASAIECKEFSFDLKEIMGESVITLPWYQCGFLQAFARRPLEQPVSVTVLRYNTASGATTLVFSGFINTFKVSKAVAEFTCLSFIEQARDNFNRLALTRTCTHRLYSSMCTVNSASYSRSATITQISSDGLMIQVSGSFPTNYTGTSAYFLYGYVRASNGDCRHICHDVREYGGSLSEFYFSQPVPESWTIGTLLTAIAGCNKLRETCTLKFNNVVNFLGFPYAPFESIRFTGLKQASFTSGK